MKNKILKKIMISSLAMMMVSTGGAINAFATGASKDDVTDDDQYGQIALAVNSDIKPGEEPASLILTAQWTALKGRTVKYVPGNGTTISDLTDQTWESKEFIKHAGTVTRVGYTFTAWQASLPTTP